jgi:hypothetical protein
MSAIYDFNDKVTMTGTLSKIDWRNPHIELIVATKNGAEVQTWSLEGPSPGFFREREINRTDVEAALNKAVTAEASRARDGSRPDSCAMTCRWQSHFACPQIVEQAWGHGAVEGRSVKRRRCTEATEGGPTLKKVGEHEGRRRPPKASAAVYEATRGWARR